jgi:hypothetical protein
MNGVVLTTGPGGLMALTAAVSQPVLEAYFYSFTKAQAVARTADPDPSSPGYFAAMTAALSGLGWTVSAADTCRIAPDGAPQVPVAACAMAFVQALTAGIPGMPVDLARIDGWVAAACTALSDPPPAVAAQLDAWWSGTEMALHARVMTVGPILEVLSTPIIPAALVSVALSGADWRSLITPSSSFELTAQPVLMALNWAAYRRIEAALVAELEDGLKAAIRTTQLDLDPHPTAEALT